MADRKRNSGKLVVAAIDFGTTYSGYAYSFKHQFERDPLQIYSHLWTDGKSLMTHKTPTTVLFDRTGTFHSFGYEAEEKYAQLSSSDKHIGWKYFRRFKMILHNQSNLKLNTKLRDDQGKRMDAIKIFSAAINYLKEHMMNRLNESSYVANKNPTEEDQPRPTSGESDLEKNEANQDEVHHKTSKGHDDCCISNSDILWVLTVPAIWSDSAKQFMRLAAVQAGIPESQLHLALEPEAAAIFSCKAVLLRAKTDASAFNTDSKFMVIDLGGGTVDITVHKVDKDKKFHEIYPPSGGPWGGTLVDEKMYEFIENIFGTKVLEIFKNESATEYLDMLSTLEIKKREVKSTADKVNLTLPSSLFEIYGEQNPDYTIADKLKETFSDSVEKIRGRLIINKNLIQEIFKDSIDNLKGHLNAIFKKPGIGDVKTIVMVGGYSECDVMKRALKESFEDKRIIIPEEASNAVLKGAVLFGHQPDVIDSRKAPCTYGIATAVPFDPYLHSEVHKYRDMCEDVFKVFIAIGADIIPGKTQVKHSFNSAKSNVVEIYKSILETPAYTTDPGCESIGEIYIDLPVGKSALIEVTMLFGDTELNVEAIEYGTENKISAKFKFLR